MRTARRLAALVALLAFTGAGATSPMCAAVLSEAGAGCAMHGGPVEPRHDQHATLGASHHAQGTVTITPQFTARHPRAAAIFDNLHMLHDIISDILAADTVPRARKRAVIYEALAEFQDTTRNVMTPEEWAEMAHHMGGIEAMGGGGAGLPGAVGERYLSPVSLSRRGTSPLSPLPPGYLSPCPPLPIGRGGTRGQHRDSSATPTVLSMARAEKSCAMLRRVPLPH